MPRELRATRKTVEQDPKRPSALRLWLRRKKPLLRPALRITAVLLLLGVGAAGVMALDPAGRLASLTERATGALGARFGGMTVTDIVIEGARNTPPALLREALAVRTGDPVLAFAPEAARDRVRQIAWIEDAHVERRLNGTVLVRVRERAPFAIWQNGGRFVIVDRDGRTVASDRLDAFGPLPLIVGPGAERGAGTLYDLLRDAPDVLVRTQALVRVGDRRWDLRLHSGTNVMLPEGHEAAAITRLKDLQARQALLDRPLQVVDMRLPDRLVLRPNPPPATPAPAQQATQVRGRNG
ncbi:cell division protein FtsQ/DivIB [Roseomonas sp. CCTCC AB2023176]|uniref:cell division protein FtsQ/DivIB n=1 Tax=Roseomonas sp. CCTCC AB2023176 TaxID=3342640 RepID=UPI0035DC2C7F